MMWVTIYHGNGPLSLSLVIVDTLLAPFLIPLILRILVGSRIRVDTAGMMEELILMIALPAILAMAFNQVSKGKVKEELLAAVGYLLGWLGGSLLHGNEKTKISMIYGVGMRNISAGAVIASAYFPAEVVFPVITATLFQQILAAVYGVLIKRYLHFPNSPFNKITG